MREKTSPRFYMREFLNAEGFNSSAHVIAEVDGTTGKYGHVQFRLGDCNRLVDLEFSLYDADDRTNSLAKTEMLFQAISGFRKALKAKVRAIEAAIATGTLKDDA